MESTVTFLDLFYFCRAYVSARTWVMIKEVKVFSDRLPF